jgi:hypothetical protein
VGRERDVIGRGALAVAQLFCHLHRGVGDYLQ